MYAVGCVPGRVADVVPRRRDVLWPGVALRHQQLYAARDTAANDTAAVLCPGRADDAAAVTTTHAPANDAGANVVSDQRTDARPDTHPDRRAAAARVVLRIGKRNAAVSRKRI